MCIFYCSLLSRRSNIRIWPIECRLPGLLPDFILYEKTTLSCSVEYNIIHLFPLHKGDMKICSPKKSHISRGQRPREI